MENKDTNAQTNNLIYDKELGICEHGEITRIAKTRNKKSETHTHTHK